MKFTEKLKSLRNNAGLTQEAAAEQIGVSVTSLQNWESGVNKPSMSNVRKIAEVYETGCDELAVSMLEDEGVKTVESNFPDFLFPDPEVIEKMIDSVMQGEAPYCEWLEEQIRKANKDYIFGNCFSVFENK